MVCVIFSFIPGAYEALQKWGGAHGLWGTLVGFLEVIFKHFSEEVPVLLCKLARGPGHAIRNILKLRSSEIAGSISLVIFASCIVFLSETLKVMPQLVGTVAEYAKM